MDNKTIKLPRSILAQIAQNNHQAVKALENIEYQALTLPERTFILEYGLSIAQQDIILARQLVDEALEQIQALQRLHPVQYAIDESNYLPAISFSQIANDSNYLNPVGVL